MLVACIWFKRRQQAEPGRRGSLNYGMGNTGVCRADSGCSAKVPTGGDRRHDAAQPIVRSEAEQGRSEAAQWSPGVEELKLPLSPAVVRAAAGAACDEDCLDEQQSKELAAHVQAVSAAKWHRERLAEGVGSDMDEDERPEEEKEADAGVTTEGAVQGPTLCLKAAIPSARRPSSAQQDCGAGATLRRAAGRSATADVSSRVSAEAGTSNAALATAAMCAAVGPDAEVSPFSDSESHTQEFELQTSRQNRSGRQPAELPLQEPYNHREYQRQLLKRWAALQQQLEASRAEAARAPPSPTSSPLLPPNVDGPGDWGVAGQGPEGGKGSGASRHRFSGSWMAGAGHAAWPPKPGPPSIGSDRLRDTPLPLLESYTLGARHGVSRSADGGPLPTRSDGRRSRPRGLGHSSTDGVADAVVLSGPDGGCCRAGGPSNRRNAIFGRMQSRGAHPATGLMQDGTGAVVWMNNVLSHAVGGGGGGEDDSGDEARPVDNHHDGARRPPSRSSMLSSPRTHLASTLRTCSGNDSSSAAHDCATTGGAWASPSASMWTSQHNRGLYDKGLLCSSAPRWQQGHVRQREQGWQGGGGGEADEDEERDLQGYGGSPTVERGLALAVPGARDLVVAPTLPPPRQSPRRQWSGGHESEPDLTAWAHHRRKRLSDGVSDALAQDCGAGVPTAREPRRKELICFASVPLGLVGNPDEAVPEAPCQVGSPSALSRRLQPGCGKAPGGGRLLPMTSATETLGPPAAVEESYFQEHPHQLQEQEPLPPAGAGAAALLRSRPGSGTAAAAPPAVVSAALDFAGNREVSLEAAPRVYSNLMASLPMTRAPRQGDGGNHTSSRTGGLGATGATASGVAGGGGGSRSFGRQSSQALYNDGDAADYDRPSQERTSAGSGGCSGSDLYGSVVSGDHRRLAWSSSVVVSRGDAAALGGTQRLRLPLPSPRAELGGPVPLPPRPTASGSSGACGSGSSSARSFQSSAASTGTSPSQESSNSRTFGLVANRRNVVRTTSHTRFAAAGARPGEEVVPAWTASGAVRGVGVAAAPVRPAAGVGGIA